MSVKVEAFRLSGRVEIDAKAAHKDLKLVEAEAKTLTKSVDKTAVSFKGLKESAESQAKSSRQVLAQAVLEGKRNIGGLVTNAREAQKDFEKLEKAEAKALKLSSGGGGLKGLLGGLSGGGGGVLGTVSEFLKIVPGLGQVAGLALKAVGPLESAVQAGLDFNDQIEKASLSFEVFSGSADKAKRHVEDLKQFATKSSLQFTDLVSASAHMQALGFDIKEVIPDLKVFADQSAALGRGAGGVMQLVDAFGKMRLEGRLTGDSMQELVTGGIPALKILADQANVSERTIRKLMEQGKLSAAKAMPILLEGMKAKTGGVDERYVGTLTGKKSNLEDAYQQTAGKATEAAYTTYKDSIGKLTDMINSDTAQAVAGGINKSAGYVFGALNAAIRDAGTAFENNGATLNERVKNTAVDALKMTPTGVLVQGGYNVAHGDEFFKDSPYKKLIKGGGTGQMTPGLSFLGALKGSDKLASQAADSFTDTLIDRTSVGIKKWREQIEKNGGEEFLKAIEALAARLKANPAALLNVMSFESSLNPHARNNLGYAGLIQHGNKAARAEGYKSSHDISSMSAIEQLAPGGPVEKYFINYIKRGFELATTGQAYAAVAGPGARNDESVIYRRGSREYAANTIWDKNHNGTITAGELASLADNRGGFRTTTDASMPASNAARDTAYFANKRLVRPHARRATSASVQTGDGFVDRYDREVSDSPETPRSADTARVYVVNFKEFGHIGAGTASAAVTESTATTTAVTTLARELPKDVASVKTLSSAVAQAAPSLGDLTKEAAKTAAALDAIPPALEKVGKKKGSIKDLMGDFGTPGFFSGTQISVVDGHGKEVEKAKAGQYALAGYNNALKQTKELSKQAFGQMSQGLGSMVSDYILLGSTGPDALRKTTAQALASASQQATVSAIMSTADGFAHLFTNPAQSAADFTAAGFYASIAVGTGIAGRKVAGNLFNGKDDKNAQGSGQSIAGKREHGGSAYKGRAYIIGERRPEVFVPDTNGHIEPSVDSFMAGQQGSFTNGSGASSGGNNQQGYMFIAALQRLERHLERIESTSPGDVFVAGAKARPHAAADAMLTAMDRNAAYSEGMGRRMRV